MISRKRRPDEAVRELGSGHPAPGIGLRARARALIRRLAAPSRPPQPLAAETLLALFGPLEMEALEALWRRAEPASVRELSRDLPGVAYTTLMTTLDRLYKKGVLRRDRRGRAFLYTPWFDRQGLRSHLAANAFEALLGGGPRAARPLLSCFVDAVSRRDEMMLDELERLVRARRRRGTAGGGRAREAGSR